MHSDLEKVSRRQNMRILQYEIQCKGADIYDRFHRYNWT